MVKADGSDGAVPRPKVGDGLPPFFFGWFLDGKIHGKIGKSRGKQWENGKIHGKTGKSMGISMGKPGEWENHLEMEVWMGQCLRFF